MRKSILLKVVSWNYDTNDQAKESAQTVSSFFLIGPGCSTAFSPKFIHRPGNADLAFAVLGAREPIPLSAESSLRLRTESRLESIMNR